ncbi:MAG: hypothetical protein JW936_08910 [Sedimentisphaerales bacterium]|nr:hypothetical protein [Sedimentisphaerales bacterium]
MQNKYRHSLLGEEINGYMRGKITRGKKDKKMADYKGLLIIGLRDSLWIEAKKKRHFGEEMGLTELREKATRKGVLSII